MRAGGGKHQTGADGRREGVGRKAAEWVTLGVSLALVLGLAGYLGYRATAPRPIAVPVAVRPVLEDVQPAGDGYVLPVEVHNGGERTLTQCTARVSYRPPGGDAETQDFTVDYLGEHASRRVYLSFRQDPRSLNVTAAPLNYTAE